MMGDYGSMADMPGCMVSGMGIVWLLVGIGALVLIAIGVIWLVTRLRGVGASGGRTATALDELDRRYARGELDRDTYLQMRRDIVGR